MNRRVTGLLFVVGLLANVAAAQIPIDWQRGFQDPFISTRYFAPGLIWQEPFCDRWGFEVPPAYDDWICTSGPFGAADTPVDCSSSLSHRLVSAGGTDNGVPLVPAEGGTRAIRIGDTVAGNAAAGPGDAAAIQRTFVVTQETAKLRYMYALVLQDPGHLAAQQPYFRVRATVAGTTVYDFTRVAAVSDPFFIDLQNGTLIRRWSCAVIDLTNYIGQTVTVRFEAGDCLPGEHFGYALVDFPCDAPALRLNVVAKACESMTIKASGSGITGVVNHFWSVERSDAAWGRNPSEEVMQWFSGPVAERDITSFAASKGRPMACGNYYRVKLAVSTECDPWIETVKLVYVNCRPNATAGPDQTICATGGPVTIGETPALPGVAYAWTVDGVPAGSESAMIVKPHQTTTFELTATETATGCSTRSRTTVEVVPDFTPVIEVCYCAPTTYLRATMPGYDGPQPTFLWSTGATGNQIGVQPSATTTYTVTADNGCNARSVSIVLDEVPKVTLIAPNVMSPGSINPRVNRFWITHLGMGAGQKPAYGATGWRLFIWNRFGNLIYYHSEALGTCDAYGNEAFPGWDARANRSDLPNGAVSGEIVPVGEYTYTLEILDCQENWKPVFVNGEVRPTLLVLK